MARHVRREWPRIRVSIPHAPASITYVIDAPGPGFITYVMPGPSAFANTRSIDNNTAPANAAILSSGT